MSNYRLPRIPGARIFFTVNLQARGSDLLTREIATLRASVAQAMAERPFRIDAWVVMPDHMHAVWTLPEGDTAYAVRWSLIKARFSLSVPPGHRRGSHVTRRERGVWQRRFWEHHIRSPQDMAACVQYCHADPLTHGLVAHPQDWPYSSVHQDVRTRQGAPA